jgi:hypothetical protein
MDAVTIRQATLADLPLLLRYRRAMAEEMETPDPLAVNRMITALEPLPSLRHSRGPMACLDC